MGPYDVVEREYNELVEQLKLAPPSAKEELFHQAGVLLNRLEREALNEASVRQQMFIDKTKRHRNMIQHLQGD